MTRLSRIVMRPKSSATVVVDFRSTPSVMSRWVPSSLSGSSVRSGLISVSERGSRYLQQNSVQTLFSEWRSLPRADIMSRHTLLVGDTRRRREMQQRREIERACLAMIAERSGAQ